MIDSKEEFEIFKADIMTFMQKRLNLDMSNGNNLIINAE